MPVPSLEEVKNYLRVDFSEDDSLLNMLINAAVADLKNSGVTNEEAEQYPLAVLLLVASYYEERRPQVVGSSVSKLSFSLERIILQLKAAELPLEEEEGQ